MALPQLRRLLPGLARHRRALLWGLLALALTTAFSVAGPWVLRHAIDDLALAVTRQKLWLYAGLILALILVEGVLPLPDADGPDRPRRARWSTSCGTGSSST